MSRAQLLVLAVGNPSRGDDAAGPLLAERLSAWLSDQDHRPDGSRPHDLTILCDQQLMVEHAYDLRGRDRVLFIDALPRNATGKVHRPTLRQSFLEKTGA